MPDRPGNYIVYDLATDRQWIAEVFKQDEQLFVFSGQDHCIWELEALDVSSFRWVLIRPLTRADVDLNLVM